MELVHEALVEAEAEETARQEEAVGKRVLAKAHTKVRWAGCLCLPHRQRGVFSAPHAAPAPPLGHESRLVLHTHTHIQRNTPCCPPRPAPPRPGPQALAARKRRERQARFLYTKPLTPEAGRPAEVFYNPDHTVLNGR